MDLTPRALLEFARTPTGRKAVRYSTVSAISIVISQLTLFVTFNVLRVATAVECQIIATAVATVPSYTLNRYWAWGKRGRSHLLKEVVPFWTLAFVGFAFSIYAVSLGASLGRHLQLSHGGVGLLVQAASLGSYGLLWVGKFVIFNRILFVDRTKPGPDPEVGPGEEVTGAGGTASPGAPSHGAALAGPVGPVTGPAS